MGNVIVGCVVGKWYFYQSDPTQGIKTGIDTAIGSLGSICLGSLIIPPIAFAAALSSFVSSFKFCGKRNLDKKFYSQCNSYAYTHVIISF